MVWLLRKFDESLEHFDPYVCYGPNCPFFTIAMHHGGYFVDVPQKAYVGGLINYFDLCDPDELSMQDFIQMAMELGFLNVNELWYRIPDLDLSMGLVKLENDRNVLDMCKWIPTFRIIDVYMKLPITDDEMQPELFLNYEEMQFDKMDYEFPTEKLQDDDANSISGKMNDKDYNFSDEDYNLSDEEVLFETNVEGFEQGDKDRVPPEQRESIPTDKKGAVNQNEEGDGFESEYDESDEFRSLNSSDDEKIGKDSNRFPEFDTKKDMKHPDFELGQLFAGPQTFRDAIREYAILNQKDISFVTNTKVKIRAKCAAPCNWVVYASKVRGEETFQVKTLAKQHNNCRPVYYNKHVTSKWLSRRYVEAIKSNPEWPLQSFMETVKRDHTVGVTRSQVYRAKRKAKVIIDGSHRDQYALLWRYCAEIKRAMPNSTVRLKVKEKCFDDSNPKFQRMYCCLGPLKKGFVESCRPIIGLDGCFLKGPFPGQMLAAVGIDGNNGIYPFAYAVVEKENKSAWVWFLQLICGDIGMPNQGEYTFMCDQQKGLVPALEQVVPNCEHRFCARHHHNNFKKEFKGKMFKDLYWKCAKASTPEYFKKCMEDLKQVSEDAHKWLDTQLPPCNWSRSHFSTKPKCDIVLNNHSEVFNKFICDARNKPIVSMMETIRELLMDRIKKNRVKMRKHPGQLCPRIERKIASLVQETAGFIVQWNGGSQFQVTSPHVQFVVDLKERTCSCRVWQLNGMPCVHGVSAIIHKGDMPESYVDECYSKDKYLQVYDNLISPLNGQELWPESTKRPLVPPDVETQPGRPKIKRRKEAGEVNRSGCKLGKQGVTMRCSSCGNTGHNLRTCKGQTDNEGGVSKGSATTAGVSKGSAATAGVSRGTRDEAAGVSKRSKPKKNIAGGGRTKLPDKRNYR